MRTSKQNNDLLLIGTLGGMAGGLTEMAWVSAYGAATGLPLLPIARGVVESVIPQAAGSAWAPALGIVIHLLLAVLLGIGLALAVRKVANTRLGSQAEFGVAIIALLAVWSVNFLIVLPNLNPGFVGLLPYSVTLVSKLLFGLSAAAIFRAYRLGGARRAI
jgi:hypothetical protein